MTSLRSSSRRRRLVGTMLVVGLAGVIAPASALATPPSPPVAAPAAPAVLPENRVVEASWLEQNLSNPKVRVIEVSTDPGLYETGHILNATKFVWHTDFVDPVSRDIVSQKRFQQLARAAGINTDSTVILYGDKNNWFAAWGVWIFKTYGFNDVRLLNGGRDKWTKDGRALTPIVPQLAPGNFKAKTADKKLRAFLADAVKVARKQDKNTRLVDIRSADEFSGKIFAPAGFQELAIRAGHIPGAQNVPWGTAVNADGTIKSIDELRKIYAAVGIDGKKPIIVYCRIGERAAHTWFVLSQLLGYNVRLYDGSWTEYGNAVGVPINNPAGTVWGRG